MYENVLIFTYVCMYIYACINIDAFEFIVMLQSIQFDGFSLDAHVLSHRLPPFVEMVIPASAIGKVLGKGGTNLANIRKVCFSDNYEGNPFISPDLPLPWEMRVAL